MDDYVLRRWNKPDDLSKMILSLLTSLFVEHMLLVYLWQILLCAGKGASHLWPEEQTALLLPPLQREMLCEQKKKEAHFLPMHTCMGFRAIEKDETRRR
jgi:hypothetical protein